MKGDRARYRFGPRERSGVLAGWRAGQILTVALGLVVGVVVLRSEPNATGVAAAVIVLVVCAALATWPLSGRTGEQWTPVVVRWSVRRVGGRGPHRGRRRMDSLSDLRLLSAGHHDMGVVHDVRARTLTAALSLRGQSFALLGPDDQDRRVAGWSGVLAALAREGSPVRRVQWLAASFPDAGQGARSYLKEKGRTDPASECRASYATLLRDIDADASTHDVSLTLQVRVGKSVEAGCAILERAEPDDPSTRRCRYRRQRGARRPTQWQTCWCGPTSLGSKEGRWPNGRHEMVARPTRPHRPIAIPGRWRCQRSGRPIGSTA